MGAFDLPPVTMMWRTWRNLESLEDCGKSQEAWAADMEEGPEFSGPGRDELRRIISETLYPSDDDESSDGDVKEDRAVASKAMARPMVLSSESRALLRDAGVRVRDSSGSNPGGYRSRGPGPWASPYNSEGTEEVD